MSIIHALKPSTMAQAVILLTYIRGSLVWTLVRTQIIMTVCFSQSLQQV